jgi:pimeloyl-ACP methyl ester carboxylesterase
MAMTRKLDREPEAKPQVGKAQLVALAKWGGTPATDRYGDLKKIKQRTLVVNGKDDIMVPTINSYILQQHLPDARLLNARHLGETFDGGILWRERARCA